MKQRIDPKALSVLLYLTRGHYRQFHDNPLVALKDIDLPRLIQAARKNKLAYQVARQALAEGYSHPLLQETILEGEKNLELQWQTLDFISKLFGEEGIDYLVIKSYKELPYVTVDIDIMVREQEYDMAVQLLETHGARHLEQKHRVPLPSFIENMLKRAAGANMLIDGLLEIDLYQSTTWTGWLCLDNEFIWRKPESVEICGVACRIPNREADLLLSLAHVIFCHGSINLLDFLYMNGLLEKTTNLDEISSEAEKYGWRQPLQTLITQIRALYQTCLCSSEMAQPMTFPYLIPLPVIAQAYWAVARAAQRGPVESMYDWATTVLKLALMLVYR